ncbi:MAG: glycosyltransferase family 4 protein [Myxococcales bacterium]|nr:glycosyltransferase family 4 protein [Myxococcales bacterium]
MLGQRARRSSPASALRLVPEPGVSAPPNLAVSIDCRYVRERPSGIGAYVQALVDRVPRLAPGSRFQLWVDPRAARPLSAEANVGESVVAAPANGLMTLTMPSRLVNLDDSDVLHAPFNILGRGVQCPTVVTVHDLMWLESPADAEGLSAVTPFKAAFYRDGILRALRSATRLIAISEATALAIARVEPAARTRTRVIHHGVESRFQPPACRETARARALASLGIRGRYLLVVGQNTPSKNHRAVLEAFAAACLPSDVHLVMLQRLYRGRRFGVLRSTPLDERAEALGIGARVVFPERLSDGALLEILQGAEALVQFSKHEGFGMPALEALACGTPVVASDIPPLVEVLGRAALHVPLNVSELARGLRRLSNDDVLRAELGARGIERARSFSWDRSAALHLEVYREAAE